MQLAQRHKIDRQAELLSGSLLVAQVNPNAQLMGALILMVEVRRHTNPSEQMMTIRYQSPNSVGYLDFCFFVGGLDLRVACGVAETIPSGLGI
jgi:hypothetical protein